MAGIARRCFVAVRRLAFVGMAFPDFGFRRVTAPTSFPRSCATYACVFCTGSHGRRLAADDPEESEQGEYANSDREKIKVFSIHKAGRTVAPQVSRLNSRI